MSSVKHLKKENARLLLELDTLRLENSDLRNDAANAYDENRQLQDDVRELVERIARTKRVEAVQGPGYLQREETQQLSGKTGHGSLRESEGPLTIAS
ncbi:hypothetical protein V5O48_002442 [Marasmius crinis-equi]|uniref:Uncharacterized protein n=1 Tax=Marasmius crinis-equi TaxID=585013 RepID=A0ABR3FVL0_9AGAR